MRSTDTPTRAIPLALAALVATFSALLVLAFSGGQGAEAHTHATATTARAVPATQAAFRNEMRRLWEDHITWTRLAIVSFAAGLPDLGPTEKRLLRNQADIGSAIKPFYGRAAGSKLTALLRGHILTAVDVLTAAKANDSAALADAQARWYANANRIATFLSGANPVSWPLPMMKRMMREHLDLTTTEAVARLQGRWATDLATYDKVHSQILKMADMLSEGIIHQFPKRFV